MNTDKHRFFKDKMSWISSSFICVYLWFKTFNLRQIETL